MVKIEISKMRIEKQIVFAAFFICFSSLLFFSCSTNSKKNTTNYAERIDWISKIAQDYVGFNGTILVGDETGIIYHKSFGFGDKDKHIPLTPEYRFSPGSIDKEFTTVAIMLLKQQGHISYDDNLSKYLPDLPAWANQVNIWNILTHTSGLPDIKYGRNLITVDAIQQLMNVEELNYEPGTDYHYGNLHSVLRAMIIEKVSGQSQDVFIKENIFTPAGMDQAFSMISLDDKPSFVAHGSLPMAVAGIDMYVTAHDLYRWEKALWNGDIVDVELLKKALAPHELSGVPELATFDFGYFTKNENEEIFELIHDGTHPSHYALQSINFDTKLIIVLLSSDGNKSTLFSLNKSIRELADSSTIQIPSSWWFVHEAEMHGYPIAIETYKSMIKSGDRVKPEESLLNGIGYDLNKISTIEDALLLLKTNLEFYPNSANAHDSYAEILLEAGKYDEAKKIAESGLILAKQDGDNFLIRSLTTYLDKIDSESGE